MKKFTKEFKEKAIRLKKEGIHPNRIFQDGGYNIEGKQKEYASKLVSRWRVSVPKQEGRKQDKEIEYLEAKVAYLKAENAFLAKLPRKKKN